MILDQSRLSSIVRFGARTALLSLLAGSAITLASCGRNEQTAKAVRQSSRDVHVISAGGGSAATPKFEKDQYTKVVSTLTPVSDKGLPEENAAAMVITAQSQIGLANQPAGDAADLERSGLDRMTVIRSLLGDWLTRNAQAAALEEFDPSSLLSGIAADSAAKDKLIAQERETKGKLDAEVADFKSQATQRQTGAQAEEDAYAKLKEQASKLNAVQSEPLIKQAADHKRTSDQLRSDAALLEARGDQVARKAAESQLLIDQYTNQKANLDATDKELRDRLQASKTEARAGRDDAAKTAGKIESLLAELRAERAGPLTQAFDAAMKGYAGSVSTANRAAKDDVSGGAKLTVGAANQAIGDVQWARARGLGQFAMLLDSLAKAEPALPKRADYARESSEATAAGKDALEAAKSAYEAAKSAYSSVHAKGDAKERLAQLSASVEALAKVASGEAKDLTAALKAAAAAEGTPAAEAPAKTETPATAALPPGVTPELAAAVESFLGAIKDQRQSEIVSMLYFPPELTSVRPALTQMTLASDKLDAACRVKFNTSLREVMKSLASGLGSTGMGAGAQVPGSDLTPEKAAAIKVAELPFTVNGDRANVTIPGLPEPLTFVNSDGKWLLESGLSKLPPATLGAIATVGGPLSTAYEELAADVQSGKIASPEALRAAFIPKLTAAVQALKPPPPGGGG